MNTRFGIGNEGRKCYGFSVLELLMVISIVIILSALLLIRVGEFRKESHKARNSRNVQELVNAIQRFQLEGHTLTDVSSVDTVVASLQTTGYLGFSPKLTTTQINMIPVVNGVPILYNGNIVGRFMGTNVDVLLVFMETDND